MGYEFAALVEDGVEYSFAVEYDGPPITQELPRAVPIDVNRIPVAAIVSPISTSDKLSLPVVQPIAASDIRGKKLGRDLRLSTSSVELLTVSPTSVIPFESLNNEVSEGSYSKELGLGTEASVSPNSLSNTGEREPENSVDNEVCGLPSDLSSEFGHCSGGEGINVSQVPSCELVSAIRSSDALGSSDSFDKLRKFSGSFHNSRISSDLKDRLDLNESNRTDWSADYPSSTVSYRNFEDGNFDCSCEVKRETSVKFSDIQSDEEYNIEEFDRSESAVVRAKKPSAVKVKRGACYRCLKGNRLSEKEVCLVCDAKYCSNCVLRAMGSMPEGRKCVTCIGFSINESRRGNLGKCSRMLKRLLNDLEVRQIMKAEKTCEVNQLPPDYICINGRTLCHDELIMLQSCPNPPNKLKPGNYWYDKVSGLWGKEGQKPSQLITPHLNVGGPIKADASSGNAEVYINGREITKVELRMLKLAGVQCAGKPHFWVNDDGSYQEEGQKTTKGYVWGKAGTKLLCAILSLPIPTRSFQSGEEYVTSTPSRSLPDYVEFKAIHKLLLIGSGGSGTSTIFKQAKILFKDTPFSEDELEQLKLVIQSDIYSYIAILLEGRELFEEEHLKRLEQQELTDSSVSGGQLEVEETPYSLSPRLKAFSDWLLKTMASGTLEAIFPAASREYAPMVDILWSDTAFQATYMRRNELGNLPSAASYFLERASEILKPDYIPSDADILFAEHVTSSNGLSCMDFSFPQSSYDDIDSQDLHDAHQRFQLIRLQANEFGENYKWLQMFEDIRLVIFCISLDDYYQFVVDGDGNTLNKMLLSKKLFENLITHPTFEHMDFLLLLNKYDTFEKKIEQIPLSRCEWFNDFQPVISLNRSSSSNSSVPTLGELGFHYIGVKFKRLYSAFTDRKLYISSVRGLDRNSVDNALRCARDMISWDEDRPNFCLNEYSVYSTEASSFSH